MSADTVDACPECDTTSGIYSRAADDPFGCRECGATFETPNTRDARQGTNTQNGLSRALADMTPEDLGL